MARILLLLSLVALAAARCPEGMTPIANDEMAAAMEIGVNSWAISAKQQWCDFLPEAINDYGLEYFNTTIDPYCKSPDGMYHFTIESKNPCDENKVYVGFMDVDTNGTDCPQTWVGNEQFPHTVAAVPFDEATFAPLACGAGFREATAEEIEGRATQLLWQTMIEPDFRNTTAGQFDDAWYCDESPGYKYINVTDVSACMAENPVAAEGSMQVKGKVLWVCAQQARRRTIALRVDTPYEMQCNWQVEIQMGDSPEVPQPNGATSA